MRSRQEARAFLLWIMAHESEPTQESVDSIVERAKKMSEHAVKERDGVNRYDDTTLNLPLQLLPHPQRPPAPSLSVTLVAAP